MCPNDFISIFDIGPWDGTMVLNDICTSIQLKKSIHISHISAKQNMKPHYIKSCAQLLMFTCETFNMSYFESCAIILFSNDD